MKAISIKQPYASLIAHGIKDIENRSWKCPAKYIGHRVLIHATRKSAYFWDTSFEISKIVGDFISEISNSGTDWSRYLHGAIIGSVVIADCVQNHPSIWAEKGRWNWVLKDARLFDNPIEGIKGKLGFWDFNM